MAQPAKPAAFGKRGGPVTRPAPAPQARSHIETTSSGVPVSELAKTLMLTTPGEDADHKSSASGVVPTSWRAGILAGLAASSLQAGYVILQANSGGDQMSAMLQAAGMDQAKTLPILLASSLLGGGEATGSTILFAHSLLKRTGHNNALAYAIGGGLVAGATSFVLQQFGGSFGPSSLPVYVATGVAAGFFYRMFAGARG